MALINIRVDDSLKENVETILEDMGLNMTTAITIYLKEIVRSKQIPFTIVSSINNIEENVLPKEEPVDETYNKIKESKSSIATNAVTIKCISLSC